MTASGARARTYNGALLKYVYGTYSYSEAGSEEEEKEKGSRAVGARKEEEDEEDEAEEENRGIRAGRGEEEEASRGRSETRVGVRPLLMSACGRPRGAISLRLVGYSFRAAHFRWSLLWVG